ncbi:MAG: glutamine--tRNA ligase/YqeY domain fusion protein [Deltaproteobacteria bacterium]|nr:glutamine--tRNA ligase/YqeY domain fusion protein [Deltaproteobacteria bacterium]
MTQSVSPSRRSNFLTDIIDADLAAGKNDQKVVTRFPPEPNGYLHIGHSKSILLNFGLAEQYQGRCHLRMDDTNPVAEDIDYVRSIEHDVAWLGGKWDGEVRFASDYFPRMYELAERLVQAGKAYVDSQDVEEMRKNRGDFGRPGVNSPFRERSIAENLDLLRRMKAGEFADGTHVLRAKVDMSHPNILMRDPLIYRIRHAHHHRTGDTWCIYPMYDYAHPLEDAIEGITHSICTLEFETNRELYDWFLDQTGPWNPRPRQYEFARLALGYTVMSKRKLLQLVQDKRVSGWDDPRMPTVAGMRRRGVTPEALRDFAERIGVAKNNSLVDIGKLEFSIRQDLEKRCPRALAVLRPVAVTLTNWPDDMVQQLDLPWWPGDPSQGTRKVPFSKYLYIDRDDFSADPPADWRRLAVGREVRLQGAYFVRCDAIERSPDGQVTGLRCSVDLHSRGGEAQDGRQPAATLHWVDARHSVAAEVRLYDRLFNVELPDGEGDFLQHLNPDSLQTVTARIEPALTEGPERVQFVRVGYFFRDGKDSQPGAPVWNQTISLKDSWTKAKQPARGAKAKAEAQTPQPTAPTTDWAALVASDPALTALQTRYGLDAAALGRLAQDGERLAYFQDAAAVAGDGALTLRWLQNDLAGALAGAPFAALPFDGKAFGRMMADLAAGKLTNTAAKALIPAWVKRGGEFAAVLADSGLAAPVQGDQLRTALAEVLAAHGAEVARYRQGETKLLGVLLGALMRQAKGCDPQAARAALMAELQS